MHDRYRGESPHAVCATEACAKQWIRTQVAILLAAHHGDMARDGDGAMMIAHQYYSRYAITAMPVIRNGVKSAKEAIARDETYRPI